ncbi:MAG: hemerythrin family protein [Bacteroidales bacterium]|nr:hemerythrin family protein [Bacteroidales bacterium]
MINEFIKHIQKDKANNYFNRYHNELAAYARFHFISEENFMEEIQYPEYKQHQQLHDNLLETFHNITINIEEGKLNKQEFINFLKAWFIHHTINEDKKISIYYKSK